MEIGNFFTKLGLLFKRKVVSSVWILPLWDLHGVVSIIENNIMLAEKLAEKLGRDGPKKLIINEDLIATMAKDFDFWNQPQFKTQIDTTAPVLNKFHAQGVGRVLEIVPDSKESLFRLE